jgi:hypothetical protein
MDYVARLAANRESGTEYAATASVKSSRRKARLTKKAGRAKLRLGVASSVKRLGKGKGRATTKKLEGSPMAKRKKAKSKRRRTAAQKAATAKMIRANKRKRREEKGPTRVKAPRKAAKRSAPKRARKGKGKRRKSGKRRSAPRRSRTQTTRTVIQKLPGHTTRIAVVPVPAAARSGRRKSRKGKGRRRAAGRKGRKKGRRKGKQHVYIRRGNLGAMENPMSGVELFVGGVTGLLGFLTADAVDRVLATHALTDKGTKDANGIELYADNPPTTGSYSGLFNATAICAPMDAKRWIVGLLVAGVPITIAHFISAPTGRAALQFFGAAAGFRILGKGLIDLVAMVAKANPTGQRLYDGEMRAAALKSGGASNPELASLPSAGLGKPTAQVGAAGCKPGCACARCGTARVPTGAGYPSMPREVAPAGGTPTTQLQPPPPPPPPGNPPPGNPPPAIRSTSLTGTNGTPMKRFGQWGAPDGV